MKIVIVGVGKVGTTLCEVLVKEHHNITIIDNNQKVVEELITKFDVSGIVGNGSNLDILKEAEISKADIIIATTELDELNILTSALGKKYGAKYAIARIRNPEYAAQTDFFNEELGIDLVINPELEAANEMLRILRFPSAESIDVFANNRVEIVGVKIKEDSELLNYNLEELRKKYKIKFLICAVERNKEAIIPNGKFEFQANDTIFFTSSNLEMVKLFKELGIYKNRARNIMIAGGGVISYYLAKQLLEVYSKVKIVELDSARCYELKELLPSASIVHGDASNIDLLNEEGFKDIDAFVTLTGFDEENIILSLYAKNANISKIITKINKFSYYDILSSLDLTSVISPKLLTANIILRYIRSLENVLNFKVETLHKFINNQVEALEFLITEESELTNVKLKDLTLKDSILIALIFRKNQIIIPTGEDVILPQDRIIVVTNKHNLYNLEILK